MRILKPRFEIVDPQNAFIGIELVRKIEYMARISHRSEEKTTASSYDRFIRSVVVGHGDWSVTEHASATVIFTVNRGVTHEMVRHRLFGYTQESTRFVNYTHKDHEPFYIPSVAVKDEDSGAWLEDLSVIDGIYKKWLSRGYAPQIARDFLPNALGAKIAVTGNLRNWRHCFLMRTSKETHLDFREVTVPLLEKFQQLIPILYEDIEPNQRQIDNLRKPR